MIEKHITRLAMTFLALALVTPFAVAPVAVQEGDDGGIDIGEDDGISVGDRSLDHGGLPGESDIPTDDLPDGDDLPAPGDGELPGTGDLPAPGEDGAPDVGGVTDPVDGENGSVDTGTVPVLDTLSPVLE
jgi:hypothetical protein